MNKRLINPELCSGISWWKEKRRKIYLRTSVFMGVITGVLGYLFWMASDTMDAQDMFMVFAMVGIFAFVSISQFVGYLKMPLLEISECWCGQIVGTRRATNSRKKTKAYYIIANVNGKELEGRCLYETYLRAEVGDDVVVFSIGKKGMHCVHCDMAHK